MKLLAGGKKRVGVAANNSCGSDRSQDEQREIEVGDDEMD